MEFLDLIIRIFFGLFTDELADKVEFSNREFRLKTQECWGTFLGVAHLLTAATRAGAALRRAVLRGSRT